MKLTSWILGSVMALALVACGDRNAGGTAGGAGTETGSPGTTADTAMGGGAMGGGAMDTATTDTTSTTGTGADTAAH
ncbi:MAG TPA: hypothetical protein VM365_03285 [Gemmatimonadales bacterium]|jgi:hypothetical protein|nr:hypothetical protein [Gemmatimonadales bacterium]